MTVIRFNTETARRTVARLRTNIGAIQQSLEDINKAMNELEAEWEGKRQVLFSAEYQEFLAKSRRLTDVVDELNSLEQKLLQTIVDFEEAIGSP